MFFSFLLSFAFSSDGLLISGAVYLGTYSVLCSIICAEFVLYTLCQFTWRVCLTHRVLFYLGSFSYTPYAILCLSYTPCATLCGEFLSHTLCYFMWEVCLTHPVLLFVGSLSYTPYPNSGGEFVLHTLCYFM